MDLTKVEVAGPCKVTYDGVDLGHTLGGITIKVARDFTKVMADKYGSTPIDYVLNGTEATIEIPLAQTEWYQLDKAMLETSSYDGSGVADRVDVGGDAGYSLRGDAKQLIIHPLKNAATDYSDDITFYLAVSTGDIEIPYKVDEQKAVTVTFTALVSEAYGAGRRLGHIGPSAVS